MLSAASRDVQAVKSELWGVASVDLDVVSALCPIGSCGAVSALCEDHLNFQRVVGHGDLLKTFEAGGDREELPCYQPPDGEEKDSCVPPAVGWAPDTSVTPNDFAKLVNRLVHRLEEASNPVTEAAGGLDRRLVTSVVERAYEDAFDGGLLGRRPHMHRQRLPAHRPGLRRLRRIVLHLADGELAFEVCGPWTCLHTVDVDVFATVGSTEGLRYAGGSSSRSLVILSHACRATANRLRSLTSHLCCYRGQTSPVLVILG